MELYLLLGFVTLVLGRPEAPISSSGSSGYSYSGPQIPLAPSPSYSLPPSAPSTSYSAPSVPQSPSGSYGPPSSQYGAPSQAPVIHKHVYVHVPPPEPEYVAPRRPINIPPPQKHYKIVFIKAPTAPSPTAPVIPVQPQNEEKTLVYVLVKKPDDQPDVVIPTPAPTQPSKPEVYFIRYKTQKQEGYPESIAPAPSADYGAPSAAGPAGAGPVNQEYGAPLH